MTLSAVICKQCYFFQYYNKYTIVHNFCICDLRLTALKLMEIENSMIKFHNSHCPKGQLLMRDKWIKNKNRNNTYRSNMSLEEDMVNLILDN